MTVKEEVRGAELLKEDTLGRVRVPRKQQDALLGEYDRSGMSGVEFARWAGVKYPTFASWVQKRRRGELGAAVIVEGSKPEGESKEPPWLSWVEAIVEDGREARRARAPEGGGLEIELSGGARLRVHDRSAAALAAEVLRHLGVGGGSAVGR